MGIGARAIALGDVGAALPGSAYGIYYNPASLPYLERMTAVGSYSFLALDRQLHFVGFATALHPESSAGGEALSAGLGVGWISAGSGDIDGRDADGNSIGVFSQSENAFSFSFALGLTERFALGFSPKVLYSFFPDLTSDESLSSTRLGFDAGVMANPWRSLWLGAQARHINAQYRWDTSTLWGEEGTAQTDKFPRIYRAGASYDFPFGLLLAGDFETSDQDDHQLHFGTEYTLGDPDDYLISLRAGYDDQDFAVGLGAGFQRAGVRFQLDYAYQIQDIPVNDSQALSFSASF